ncbi:MAG: matrixin family metalloprotease [Verrucomicrobia bacterium]|nr:matrixin family metalloprotease [Verrucomicrobiota bacterium]
MNMSRPVRSTSRLANLLTTASLAVLLLGGATTARAVTFIPGNWAAGYGNTNNFARWEQATITYSYDPSFVQIYGLGGEVAVDAAFSTWNTAVGIGLNPGTDLSAPMVFGDPTIIGPSLNYDLESVALHEIGHALGLEHPNLANGITSTNYNISGGGFVAGALPGGSHPVMWSTIASDLRRRDLTDDDLYGTQYMYDATNPVGPGNAGIGGPVFGDGAVEFTFSEVASGGNIVIKAGSLPPGTLASTIGTAAFKPARSYGVTTYAEIIFIPEPGGIGLMLVGGGLILLRRKTRRR